MNKLAWLLMVMLGVGLVVWKAQSIEASDGTARYLVMQNQLLFEYTNEQPYTILGPMCWNSQSGWCDSGMDEPGHRLVYFIDFEEGRHGVVMQNDSGCWTWWFFPEYGEDSQPHVAEAYWIECRTYFSDMEN
jgi:hypothetical protein